MVNKIAKAPPDPELVAYLRANVPKFGEAPVREKLLEEGVAAAEIDEALAASKRRTSNPPRMFFLLFAIAAVAAAGYLLLDQHPPKPAPAASDKPAGIPANAPLPKGFIGHYGYVFQRPPGYRVQTFFKDFNKTEVVYLFPPTTDPTNLGNEGLYGALGILRLEVSPLGIPQGTRGLEAVRAGITRTLTGRGDTFSLRDISVGGMAGFIVEIKQPLQLTQAFVLGTKVLYVFTGGPEDQKFRDVLNSLTEVSPRDRPTAAPN